MDHLERQRYIEYFQRQLMREGLDSYWQGYEDWFDRNRATIAEQYRAIAKHEIANEVIAHQNKGEYDNFFSRQIFEPMVKKVLEICEEEGFPLRNPVSFVNSPAAEPSPAALPSSAEHLLFIGPSTFAFCNYWSKVFSSAMAEVGTLSEEERKSPEAMISKLKQGQVLVDAARLALRYAHFESLLGFGHIEQSKELVGFRTLLLNAMEVFIIGHEIGHFIGHELHPKTAGIPPGLNSQDHELECDGVGLFVSTVYGVREGNAFAFQPTSPHLE